MDSETLFYPPEVSSLVVIYKEKMKIKSQTDELQSRALNVPSGVC